LFRPRSPNWDWIQADRADNVIFYDVYILYNYVSTKMGPATASFAPLIPTVAPPPALLDS
jgi:hypothetical protein